MKWEEVYRCSGLVIDFITSASYSSHTNNLNTVPHGDTRYINVNTLPAL
jgi:hypothetical protein